MCLRSMSRSWAAGLLGIVAVVTLSVTTLHEGGLASGLTSAEHTSARTTSTPPPASLVIHLPAAATGPTSHAGLDAPAEERELGALSVTFARDIGEVACGGNADSLPSPRPDAAASGTPNFEESPRNADAADPELEPTWLAVHDPNATLLELGTDEHLLGDREEHRDSDDTLPPSTPLLHEVPELGAVLDHAAHGFGVEVAGASDARTSWRPAREEVCLDPSGAIMVLYRVDGRHIDTDAPPKPQLSAAIPGELQLAATAAIRRAVTGEDPTSEPERDPPAPVDCAEADCLALTFDDGPGPHTSRLLDELARREARATFFVLGEKVAANGELLRRMLDDDHELGNHSWNHPWFTRIDGDELGWQLDATVTEIERQTGVTPRLVRPPYGALDEQSLGLLAERGESAILWDVDTRDWGHRDTAATIEAVLDEAERGSIVLMHDIHESTVDAIPRMLDELQSRGHTLVTVTELLAGSLVPGEAYRAAR